MKHRLLALVVTLLFFCASCAYQNDLPASESESSTISNLPTNIPKGVVCSVNGEYIYDSEITDVYRQFDGKYTYNKILNDSIIELLVVQKSSEYGLAVSDDELQSAISYYESQYPSFYNAALETNTKDQLEKKLKATLLFSKTKKYVCQNIISNKENITEAELYSFQQSYGLTEHLSEYSNETIIYSLWDDIQNYLFSEWSNSLKSNAQIIFFNPDDPNSEIFYFAPLPPESVELKVNFDDNIGTRKEQITFNEAVSYIGHDFRPTYVPSDLQCILDFDKSHVFELVYDPDNSVAYDVFTITYEEDFKSSDPLEKLLSIQISKQQPVGDSLPISNSTFVQSVVGNTCIELGEAEISYGPYIETSDKISIPAGYSQVFISRFFVDGVFYRITAQNIDRTEFIKIISSIV